MPMASPSHSQHGAVGAGTDSTAAAEPEPEDRVRAREVVCIHGHSKSGTVWLENVVRSLVLSACSSLNHCTVGASSARSDIAAEGYWHGHWWYSHPHSNRTEEEWFASTFGMQKHVMARRARAASRR